MIMEHVKFTEMRYGDREDYELLEVLDKDFAAKTGQRIFNLLEELRDSFSGFQISRLSHSLQSATRAWWDGADVDWIMAALLHDIGDLHAPYTHGEYAANVVRPFIREQCTWTIQVHADFQKYYYAHLFGGDRHVRDIYQKNPYYRDCIDFCELWDQTSFDPNYQELPLDFFQPMILEIFERKPFDPQVIQNGKRVPLVDDMVASERAAANQN